MPLTISFATYADVDDIYRLINAAFQVENFFKYQDRLTRDQVQAYFGAGTFLLASAQSQASDSSFSESKTVGCVYVELQGERAYLGLLAIDPEYQRAGLGSRLLTSAEKHALASGSRYVDIRVVSVRPELVAIYTRVGFEITGTEPFPAEVPTKIPCHFLTMSKSL